MGVVTSTLDEKNRSKLDGIVQQMIDNKEPEENIRFVVDDFKSKYSGKKKDQSLLGGVTSAAQSSGLASQTDTLPETEADISRRKKEDEYNNIQNLPGFRTDPLKAINKSITAEGAATMLAQKPVSESTGQKYLQPFHQVDEHKINEFSVNNQKNAVRENIFPTTQAARDWFYSDENKGKSSQDNETVKFAESVINEQKKIKDIISSNNGNLKESALQYFSEKDPQIKTILKEGKEVPEETKERLLGQFLNDKQVKELAYDEPTQMNFGGKTFNTLYGEEKGNFRQRNPLQWTNDIVQKIAQGREDYGYNNPFLNLTGVNSSDKIIENLYTRGEIDKQDYQHYYETVRPLLKLHVKQIPTSGALENAFQSTVKSITELPRTIAELTGARNLYTTPGERQQEILSEDENAIPFQPKGLINNISHATGNIAGVILPISGEAKVLQGLNLVKDINKATQLSMGLTFYHDIYKDAERANPEGGLLNQLQATLQATVFAKLNPVLGRLSGAAIKEATPEIQETLKQLQSNAITGATAQKSLTNTILDKIVSATKQSVSGSTQMAVAGMINDAIGGVFTGKYDFDESVQKAAGTFQTMMYGTFLPSLLITPGAKSNVGKTMYEMTSNPETSRATIEKAIKENPKLPDEILQNFDHATEVRKQLDEMDLSQEQKEKYLVAEVNQKIIQDKIDKSKSKTLNGKDQAKVEELETEKKDILAGKEEPKTPEQELIQKALANNEIQGMYKNMAEEAVKTPEGAKQLLEDATSQINNKVEGELGDSGEAARNAFGKTISDHLTEKPESKPAAIIPLKKTETSEPATNEADTKATQPVATEEVPPTETIPPETGGEAEELPFGQQPTSGIAHEVQEGRAYDVKASKPERGEGVTVEESIKHGQDLLADGKDPNKAAADFAKDKKVSYDDISLVRAKQHQLERATNEVIDKYGENSKEAQAATKEERDWYNNTVKPMQTEWSKIGVAQQGQVDIDTGSFAGLRRAKEQNTGKPLTDKQKAEAKELSAKVSKLEKENEDLKQKLDEALEGGGKEKGPKTSIKLKGKALANKIRGFKTKGGDKAQANLAAIPVAIYDGALELVATAVENGAALTEAIQKGIEHLKANGYLKNKEDEEDFGSHIGEMAYGDLLTHFIDKKDNTFSPEESKGIWEYTKNEYLDKGATFSDAVHKVGTDLGLKPQQVIDALATPKGARKITDQMYRISHDRNKAIMTAKNWATKTEKSSVVSKFLDTIASPFRGLATLGHGHALLFTHAGMNLFDPRVAKTYFNLLGKQFKIVYGNQKYYDQAESSLTNHPLYNTGLKSGLAVDPHSIYDDWQLANTFLKRLKIQGNKGFLVLKLMRMKIFENEVKKLSEVEKQDPETLKEIARIANHWTGTAGIKPSPAANAFIFAPNLIVSKFARITTDPIKAVATLVNWKNASVADKAAAKVIIAKSARIASMYLAALAANQGLLMATGSNQNINFLNPFKSDWLKLKAGNKVIDPSSGMQSTLGFVVQLGALPFEGKKDIKDDYYGAATASDAVTKLTSGYMRKIASPFGGTIWDVATHKDFEGNVLPMYNDKAQAGKRKLSYFDYFMEKAPIPISEGYRDFGKQMEKNGTPKPLVQRLLNSIIVASAGSSGLKVAEEPKERPTPFNDTDKKDPTFKYFLDKGMELPNTSLSSEEVKDEATKTKKKISEYPEEKQKEYINVHKEYLKEELATIKDRGYVFVNPYGDVSEHRVHDAEKKSIDELTKAEIAQVLHIAQSQATKKAKQKVFNQKY